MHRRQFLAASLASSALAVTRTANAQAAAARGRDFYQIRRYSLQSEVAPAPAQRPPGRWRYG